jgi:leucyl-tRNA synthetase
MLGLSYDWGREINSSSPDYYKWTQWFFLLLYDRGLAYRARAFVNYCPRCGTVLAREEVEGGFCWRCHAEVIKIEKEQWFFRITAYADRLLNDLNLVDWPENIVEMQRNWIGRSEGVEFNMPIVGLNKKLSVFTTRPDTIYGMTYVVVSPEHPITRELVSPNRKNEVGKFMQIIKKETEIERLSTEKQPLGVFTGSYAKNPLTRETIPIYLADYVLSTYATGAIMAVPAHDDRDFAFSKRYNLPIKVVIQDTEHKLQSENMESAYTGEGIMVDSDEFNALPSEEGRERITEYIEALGIGRRTVYYRLRDWLISRQRYWGAPIPIVYCKRCGEVTVRDLPVLLPDVDEYRPSGTGESPLAGISDFVHTTCPVCGGKARRETDTMGGFVCSSWYFLRFASPRYDKAPFDKKEVEYWLPVDLYVGGAEHAVMHLLYARFWTKVMYDAGLINFVEPFARLRNQGVVHAPTGKRMSKSRRNVIIPDEIVERHGADALRLYELFVAPFDQPIVWNTNGIVGQERFLKRVWGFVVGRENNVGQAREKILCSLHRTIKKVTEDIEAFKFNTAIASIMQFMNEIQNISMDDATHREVVENLILILSPFAPHICEELWQRIGKDGCITDMPWPRYSEELVREELVTIPVQVNGKLRATLKVERETGQEEIERLARERVMKWIRMGIKRIVYIQDRLINIVTERMG